MRKSIYLLLVAGLFTFTSCDSREENRQEGVEDTAEEVGEDMEDTAEEVEDETTEVVQ